jgi:hypothetical protein
MLPDLRLLISATVATFFLAATAGLYASLRITQEQIAARAEARAAHEDNPITRIANTWPTPEPGRTAALRELAKIAIYVPPIVAATEPESETDHSGVAHAPEKASPGLDPGWKPVFGQDHAQRDVVPDATQSTMPPSGERPAHAALSEHPAPEVTASTGIAAQPETGAVIQTDHPDLHGNIGEAAAREQAKGRAEKSIQPARKKPQITVKKVVRVVRRRKPAPPTTTPPDQLITGYPLYLTVPVTN